MGAKLTSALPLALLLAACIPAADAPYRSPPPPRPPATPPPPAASDPSAGALELPPPPEDVADDQVSRLPAPRPAWEARPVLADAQDVAETTYTVRPGDSLRRIAERTGAGSEAIARANGLAAPFTIQAGQQLRIPGGRYHLVRTGDTGIAIARAYGVEWSRIVAANDLDEPYILRTGQRVLIPDAAGGDVRDAGSPRYAERAAAFSLDIDDILTGGEPAIPVEQAPAKAVATPRRVLPATAAIAPPVSGPGRFAWPVSGNVVKRFGAGASGERNDGIKIAVPVDTPIKAAADGTVAYVGDGIAALGGLVIIRHGENWTSVYGHASKLLVQRGQSVKKGQTIALSGASGFADRPELHFELRRGRTPVDPATQLPRR